MLEEIKRHLDVLAEGLEKKIQALAEGQLRLERKIDLLGTNIEGEFEETRRAASIR